MVTPPRISEALFGLAEMPDFLERMSREIGVAKASVPGPGGSFSLVEHVWHLADLEREGFGERIERLQREERPFLPDFEGDRIARERDYPSRSLDEGLAAFRTARARNLEALRGVADEAWDRSGVQEHVGPVALRDIPARVAEHDASHREEIRALVEHLRGGA